MFLNVDFIDTLTTFRIFCGFFSELKLSLYVGCPLFSWRYCWILYESFHISVYNGLILDDIELIITDCWIFNEGEDEMSDTFVFNYMIFVILLLFFVIWFYLFLSVQQGAVSWKYTREHNSFILELLSVTTRNLPVSRFIESLSVMTTIHDLFRNIQKNVNTFKFSWQYFSILL